MIRKVTPTNEKYYTVFVELDLASEINELNIN